MSTVKDNKDGSETKEEWNDVTSNLDEITKTMDLGQMIHGKDFSLKAAMSALEIGDGVLDAAMSERLLYMDNILKDNELLLKLFNVEQNDAELLGTLDELIRLLWSFFNRYIY